MRVLYTSNVSFDSSNGPAVNEQEFVNYLLNESRLCVYLLLAKKNNSFFKSMTFNVKYLSFTYNVIIDFFLQVYWLFKIRSIRRKSKIEIIVLRLPLFPLFFYLFYAFVFGNVIVHVKTQGILGKYSYTGNKLPKFAAKLFSLMNSFISSLILRKVSLIDACTPEIVKNLKLNLNLENIFEVQNSVNTDKFNCINIKHNFNIPVIGYVGGCPEERGAEQIIKMLDYSESKGDRMRAVIVGFRPDKLDYYLLKVKNRWKLCSIELYGKIDYSVIEEYFYKFNIGLAFDTNEKLHNVGSSNQKIRQYLSFGHPCLVPVGTNNELLGKSFVKHVDPRNTIQCVNQANLLFSDLEDGKITNEICRKFAIKYLSIVPVNELRIFKWQENISNLK